MRLNFNSKKGQMAYKILGIMTWIIFFIGFYVVDYNEISDFELLRNYFEKPPLNMSELKEEIKIHITNLDQVNLDSFEILTNQLAKDNSNIYYIRTRNQNSGFPTYTLSPLSLKIEVEINSLQPIFPQNHNNLSLSTPFFKDNNTIYFLDELKQLSELNQIFKPLQNVSKKSWSIVSNSSEFSYDNNYIYFKTSIITNFTTPNIQYFGNSYMYHDDILYFETYPLVKISNLDSFEYKHTGVKYKILEINNSIWIHQESPKVNIFLQNVSDVSSFEYVGPYRDNRQIYNSLNLDMLHGLYEDSQNYYSIDIIRLPISNSMIGVRRANYLEEMKVVEYFEIHPKE